MKKIVVLIIAILVAAIHLPFSSHSILAKDSTSNALQRNNSNPLAAANTQFAFQLYAKIVKQNQGKNILISPFSVSTALSMVYNGAGHETKSAMSKTLGYSKFSLDEMNKWNRNLLQSLQNVHPKSTFRVANSLWGSQQFAFSDSFIQRNQEYLHADVKLLDFSQPDSAKTINDWISQKTNGKINQAVSGQLQQNTELLLVNAVYFKCEWLNPFSKSLTKPLPFYPNKKSYIMHPFMSQTGSYRYLDGTDFQAVELPYKKGYRMAIFLPDATMDLLAFQQKLNPMNWKKWSHQFMTKSGTIFMPRFQQSVEVDLKKTLEVLGLDMMFDNRADFSNMSADQTSNMHISQIQHQAVIDVNESGTEASASTQVSMTMKTSVPKKKFFKMKMDRPFFYAIIEKDTESILFMGAVMSPK